MLSAAMLSAAMLSAAMLSRLGRAARQLDVAQLRTQLQPIVRDGLARSLSAVGMTRPRRFARGALTVLTFHRVLPAEQLRQYPLAGLAVTPEQLEQILARVKEHFECSTLIGAYRSWQRQPSARRP